MASYREFSDSARKRRRRQGLLRFLVLLVVIVIILAIAYLVVKIAEILYPQAAAKEDFTPVSSLEELLTPESDSDSSLENDDSATSTLGPVQVTVDAAALTNPDYRMISLPENGRVDMSYFDDATFIGDSLTQGLELYNDNTFANSHYAAWKGVSPMTMLQNEMAMDDGSTVNALDYIVSTNPGKIYILLGSNALSWQQDDVIISYYAQLLDELGARLPNCLIYVQSIPTVTAEEEANRTAKGQDFTQARINALNDQFAKMAYVRGLYFIDLQETLCGDDGYLKPEYDGGDGLHLNAQGYLAWREYLITHTAHRWDNPYLIGSPYYVDSSSSDWLSGDATSAAAETPAETPAEGTEQPANGAAEPTADPAA